MCASRGSCSCRAEVMHNTYCLLKHLLPLLQTLETHLHKVPTVDRCQLRADLEIKRGWYKMHGADGCHTTFDETIMSKVGVRKIRRWISSPSCRLSNANCRKCNIKMPCSLLCLDMEKHCRALSLEITVVVRVKLLTYSVWASRY